MARKSPGYSVQAGKAAPRPPFLLRAANACNGWNPGSPGVTAYEGEGLVMLDEFSLRLLDDFVDDWYGVWEFDWTLNMMEFDADPEARVPLLKQFAEQGLIDVFRSNWETIRARAAVPLPLNEAVEAVSDYSNWRAPTEEDDEYHLFITNDDGAALIQRSFTDGKYSPPEGEPLS